MESPNIIVQQLRSIFATKKTFPYSFRLAQLENMRKMINENHSRLVESLTADFKKPHYEIELEITYCLSVLNYTISNLKTWMSPKKRKTDLMNFFNHLQTVYEPYGVVLIMSPWNYPLTLALDPFQGAIAAGNCVVLKPSEFTPNLSKLYSELFPKYLDNDCYKIVTGEADVGSALLSERFDFIFFTGSTRVGKIVMSKASENLTPVCLELGGKCPCYINKGCNVDAAAKKVAWASTINAGQLCISVDYILCDQSIFDEFVGKVKKYWIEFYGQDAKQSSDFGRIVNNIHFKRISELLKNTSGEILAGGNSDEADLYIEPTLVHISDNNDALMKEEIFGPVVPIMKVSGSDEAISMINKSEKPLVVYVFTKDSELTSTFQQDTSSGTIVFNDIYLQITAKDLPFGGVGHSGFGSYHGKQTFKVFSHKKGIYKKGFHLNYTENFTFPPMTTSKFNLIKKLI